MIDFLMIATRSTKRGIIEIYPKFIIKKSSDLMIRGGDFYAIWVEERGLWSTDEQDALYLMDQELDRYAEENRQRFDSNIKVLHLWDAETGMIDFWHKYCQRQMRDSFHMLDEKLMFSNVKTNKKDYASKRLSYPLEQGTYPAYEKLMSTLYSPDERMKIEWAIGAIVHGDSKKLQKFMVLYGAAGTGKSTILNIIQQLFEGYYSVFDAKALGSSSNSFALESFKGNPLVAIQHDGDLSRIEDNTRLNSLVSHEIMTVNEKFKSTYANSFKCFLIMGTNKPVKITDAKSGLIRRLIDVSPSGEKLSMKEYKQAVKQIEFELGAIAYHCQEVYLDDPGKYDDYIPMAMLGASNDFYNFIIESYYTFKKEDGVTLKAAWEMYKNYCDDAKVPYPFSQRVFKEELKNYFREYKERFNLDNGSRVRSYYTGFCTEKFESEQKEKREEVIAHPTIQFDKMASIFDKECSDCYAQYASSNDIPTQKWAKVETKLSDLDTSKVHYVQVPENHIVIDFDIPDETGKKSFSKNLEEASKWPPTYAELSKGGAGIHLHYIYSGDVNRLSRVYDDHIEVKVFTGNSSLRRRLSKCNNLPIATINSGLPLKGESKVVNFEGIKSEKGLRTSIKRNLNKEIHDGTKPSVDFIYKILEDAHASDLKYDVSDMRNEILSFATNSTHQANYCIKLVNKMQFKSDDPSLGVKNDDAKLVFYDVEVFPNLFVCNWKIEGSDKPVVRMINPSPIEIEDLIKFRLVGFNCRRYDNHILYAWMMGYSNEQLYNLSQRIIRGDKNCFFGEAYNISYTDVFDFASATNKMSLKKFEILLSTLAADPKAREKMSAELLSLIDSIKHHELGLPWDEPVPKELWDKVAEYCDDDVIATEATFEYLSGDWAARLILAELSGLTPNDTTNQHSTRIIFGNTKNTKGDLVYTDLSQPVNDLDEEHIKFLKNRTVLPMKFVSRDGVKSILPFFPGYKYDYGKSTYRGEEVGEGGYVYSEPGMYGNVALLDIASMHPTSVEDLYLFGDFTWAFSDIKNGRISIKHKDFEHAKKILEGKLTPFVEALANGTATYTATDLANALKTVINSVYGLTSAGFDNPFRDQRNKDNIVAKRGALFMIDLKYAVQEKGFTVAHIKTDSIKIPDATPEIIQFVMDFGKMYGYTFEHEATYDRMCLVNKAVYIARYKDGSHAGEWTATGAQFAVPYVLKTLFTKEDILLSDLCEVKSVQSALYLDMNESLPDVSKEEARVAALRKENVKLSKDSDFQSLATIQANDAEIEKLLTVIEKGHNRIFVGKIGNFCPMKPGCGGGILQRQAVNKQGLTVYNSATGADGYRWMEADIVEKLGKGADIDRSYYNHLVDEAVSAIEQYGGFEWFVSDDPYDKDNNDILPF